MFKKLKMLMFGNDITQAYLCQKLKRSATYISRRMTGKEPFSMDDVYEICEILNIPHEKIAEYFPRGGRANG